MKFATALLSVALVAASAVMAAPTPDQPWDMFTNCIQQLESKPQQFTGNGQYRDLRAEATSCANLLND